MCRGAWGGGDMGTWGRVPLVGFPVGAARDDQKPVYRRWAGEGECACLNVMPQGPVAASRCHPASHQHATLLLQ